MITLLLSAAFASPHRLEHEAHRGLAPLSPSAPATPPVGPSGPKADRAIVYGYHPYWGVDPTTLDFERLTHLAIFAVEMESDGSLSGTSYWTRTAPSVVPLAHAHGVKVHLTAIAFYDDQHDAILPSASRRAAVIAELVELVEAYDGDGVNLDIEGMSSAYRDELVTFTRELKAALPEGRDEVWHATPAVDWSDAYDYEALCEVSDGLFIMGYGYHWTGGDPGPNAPLYGESPWSKWAYDWTVEDYLANGAPADCLVLGMPTYGQYWPMSDPGEVPGDASGTGSSVTMASALPIAASEGRRWDEVTKTPYVIRSGGQLWYDDTESLREKIAWAVDQGLGGVGFWALGYEGTEEGPAFWAMVEEETVFPAAGDGGGAGDGGASDGGASDGGEEGGLGHREELPKGGCGLLGPGSVGAVLVALLGIRGRAGARRGTRRCRRPGPGGAGRGRPGGSGRSAGPC